MKPIIEVNNLSKKYRISHQKDGMSYFTLRDELVNFSKKFMSWKNKKQAGNEDILALNNISFSVERGEALGIIGPNGAGKSTLLKILTRITPPTDGKVVVRGLVGSLLEVGTGFHPELTGRENIFLNGSILGMKKKEIEKKFDEIVDFSGVRKFLDTPVKRFSSGMSVRLAFSIAAHLDPDILLIDEVLSVGDAAFQKKSFNKMEEVTQKGDRTILFVSHNLQAVKDLCKRCILLDSGKIRMTGPTDKVINTYLDVRSKETRQKFPIDLDNLPRKSGGGDFRMTYLDVEGGGENIASGKDLIFKIGFDKKEGSDIDDLVIGIDCLNSKQEQCFMIRNDVYRQRFLVTPGRGYVKITIPRLPLSGGFYSLRIMVFSYKGRDQQGTHDWIENGIDFSVQSGDFYGTGHPGFPECASMYVDSKWDLVKK